MFSYLASPYTFIPSVIESKYPETILCILREEIERRRFEATMDAVAFLLDHYGTVYSPISHYHPIARRHKLEGGIQFWRNRNLDMLIESRELIVLTLEGWRLSSGVKWEMEQARENSIPLQYLHKVEAGYSLGTTAELS